MDQIFTDKNLLGKAWEYNIEIHLIFINFQESLQLYTKRQII
jgi:hypothetical protein